MTTPTPHIECQPGDIAATVLMPGDPLRAKYIAETFLEDVKQVNGVRGMLAYTGTYEGRLISVMASGMGMPSIGIYSFELFSFYGVERIIRVGSCGAYSGDLNLYDVVIAEDAWSESSFAKTQGVSDVDVLSATPDLVAELEDKAAALNIDYVKTRIHSSDVFYRQNFDEYQTIRDQHGCQVVEMEAFALFANAMATGKQAACVLTVSDSLVTQQATTSAERESAFTSMMKIALQMAE
ncbi:MAG: purine-nucleoside phosphorylase [Gammaproteobacteria bacterium]|jgi:purine-nucleoside phosphorylase|nr:purine-nucleoside phosphorylase [Gammaproteobacteria bacterium]MCP4881882.1 purine-nucleoside phosphorylase [Gammaproteobacteria bacterium]MDP6165021.1 purine-nucleoside phosphorylase [Gammaproteobacteria bacterium]